MFLSFVLGCCSCLATEWSFQALLLNFARWDQSGIGSTADFSPSWVKAFGVHSPIPLWCCIFSLCCGSRHCCWPSVRASDPFRDFPPALGAYSHARSGQHSGEDRRGWRWQVSRALSVQLSVLCPVNRGLCTVSLDTWQLCSRLRETTGLNLGSPHGLGQPEEGAALSHQPEILVFHCLVSSILNHMCVYVFF